jgi:hypothetical protein
LTTHLWLKPVKGYAKPARHLADQLAQLGYAPATQDPYLAALFATGYLLYGRLELGLICLAIAVISAYALARVIPRVGFWTA